LKRSSPIRRDTEKSREWARKRTPLRSRSGKRKKFMAEVRVPAIRKLVEAGCGCEIGPVLANAGMYEALHCRGVIEGLHERRKRSAGGSLINEANLVPSCNWCNGLIESEPNMIRRLTGSMFIVSEGDDEWDNLGKRNDDSL